MICRETDFDKEHLEDFNRMFNFYEQMREKEGVVYRDIRVREDQMEFEDSSDEETIEDYDQVLQMRACSPGTFQRTIQKSQTDDLNQGTDSGVPLLQDQQAWRPLTGAQAHLANITQIKHVLSVPPDKLSTTIDTGCDFRPGLQNGLHASAVLSEDGGQKIINAKVKLNMQSNSSLPKDPEATSKLNEVQSGALAFR